MEEVRPGSTLSTKEKLIIGGAVAILALGIYQLIVIAIMTLIFGPKHSVPPHIDSGIGNFPGWIANHGVASKAWTKYNAASYFPSPVVQIIISLFALIVLIVGVTFAYLWYDTHRHTVKKITKGPRLNRKARVGVEPAVGMATLNDVKPLIVPKVTSGRITLGYFKDTAPRKTPIMIATEDTGENAYISPGVPPELRAGRSSVIILAPSQAGKSTGLAYPAVVDWDGPVLAASVKSDVLANTIRARQKLNGEIKVFDPRHTLTPWGIETALWSPISGITNYNSATSTARGFIPISASSGGNMDFWYSLAGNMIGVYLYAAAKTNKDMKDVMVWIKQRDSLIDGQGQHNEVITILEALADNDADRIVRDDAMRAQIDLKSIGKDNKADKTMDSIVLTAMSMLEIFTDDDLAKTKDSQNLITPGWLLSGKHTLYIAAPAAQQRDIESAFVGIIQSIIDYAYDYATRKGAELPYRLLVLLDEAANIAPLKELDTYASTAASHGIQLVTIFQDYAQIKDRWGQDQAQSIFNNHQAKLLMGAIHDQQTLELFSQLTGQEEYIAVSQTAGDKTSSENKSVAMRPHLPIDVLRRMPSYHALMIYRNLPPIFLQLRSHFNDPELKAKMGIDEGPYLQQNQLSGGTIGRNIFQQKVNY